MNLHNLKPAEGSTKNRKRIGRGEGSGHGGTSTRGHKGAKSRSGYSRKLGFEGGHLDTIQQLVDSKKITSLDIDVFVENGLASKHDRVKVLGRGELKTKLEVKANGFSATAKAAIEAAGGTTVVL